MTQSKTDLLEQLDKLIMTKYQDKEFLFEELCRIVDNERTQIIKAESYDPNKQ